MKKSVLLFLAVFTACFAQAQTGLPRVEQSQTMYHLIAGFSHEQGLSRLATVRFSGPLNIGLLYEFHGESYGGQTYSETEFGYHIRPNVNVDFRYYYNMNKRNGKGKRTDRNSGNFIAGNTSFYGPALLKSDNVIVDDFSFAVGTSWGIQRNYGESFNMQIWAGPGVGFSGGDISFVPFIGAAFGFRLGK